MSPENTPEKTKLRSFFLNNWILILFFLGFACVAVSKWLGLLPILSCIAYMPVLVTGTMLSVALLRNVFNRTTTDKYIDSGMFTQDWWNELEPSERVYWTMLERFVYFIGCSLIAAGLANGQ